MDRPAAFLVVPEIDRSQPSEVVAERFEPEGGFARLEKVSAEDEDLEVCEAPDALRQRVEPVPVQVELDEIGKGREAPEIRQLVVAHVEGDDRRKIEARLEEPGTAEIEFGNCCKPFRVFLHSGEIYRYNCIHHSKS